MDLITQHLTIADLDQGEILRAIRQRENLAETAPFLRKGLIAEKLDVNGSERTVTAYISTMAKDRDDEILLPRGAILEDYRKNPVVQYAHDRARLPIGKNLWIKVDGAGLIAKTLFAKHDFAEQIFQLYREGFLNAWSVGFLPIAWVPKDGEPIDPHPFALDPEDVRGVRRMYTKWTLLEYSAVPVPANPEALTIAVGKGILTNERLRRDLESAIQRPGESANPPSSDPAAGDPETQELAEPEIEKPAPNVETAAPSTISLSPEMSADIPIRARALAQRAASRAIEHAIDEALSRARGRI